MLSIKAPTVATSIDRDDNAFDAEILICEASDGTYKTVKTRNTSDAIRISPDSQFDNIYFALSQNQFFQKAELESEVPVCKFKF